MSMVLIDRDSAGAVRWRVVCDLCRRLHGPDGCPKRFKVEDLSPEVRAQAERNRKRFEAECLDYYSKQFGQGA